MKSVTIGGVTVEIDEERSKVFGNYAGWPIHWCQCDGCTNACMDRLNAAPLAQTQMLETLSLDPLSPFHSAWSLKTRRGSWRFEQRISCWFAYGKVVGADHTPVVQFDQFNSMWVETRRPVLNSLVENLHQVEPDEPGMIYIVTSNRLLWLYGEVCSFRQDYSAFPCPDCSSRWRMTGYLKRNSLIPQWRKLPELSAALRERDKRVYVEFCVKCGRMEYEVVNDRPPFRRKNHVRRDEMRLAKFRSRQLQKFGIGQESVRLIRQGVITQAFVANTLTKDS